MTVSPRITFSAGRYLLDGKPLPRVSDILSVINKPGLTAWRARVGNEEADRVSKVATDLGTAVHAACEGLNREMLTDGVFFGGTGAEALRPFTHAYEDFLIRHVRRVLLVEERVYHERHRYAGTLDVMVELNDGRTCVVDLKTGKTVDYVSTPLQLAAYACAVEEMGMAEVNGRLVVHLPSDRPGQLFLHDFSDREVYDPAWRAAVRLWRHYEASKDGWKKQGRAL